MHDKLAILLSSVLALACSPPATGPGGSEPSTATQSGGLEPSEAGDEASCQSDADCTISCAPRTGCCGELCECTQAYTNAELTEIRARMQSECTEAECPVADCAPPEADYMAVCEANRCVTRTLPLSRAE